MNMDIIVFLIWCCFAFAALMYFSPSFYDMITVTEDEKLHWQYWKRQSDTNKIRKALQR